MHRASSCCNEVATVPQAEDGVRITATLPKKQERMLRALAAKHKVSVAWLVRQAVDRLLSEGDSIQLPFDFRSSGGGG